MNIITNRQKTNLIFGTGTSAAKNLNELNTVVQEALADGIVHFDTAPSYKTESILAESVRLNATMFGISREQLWFQTKIDAWQMQEGNGNITKYVDQALSKMKLDYLDAFLIHWPIPEYLKQTWECMCKLRETGKIRYVGVCNVDLRLLNKLAKWDILPQIIQLERHPLRSCHDEIMFCKEHDIQFQAYSALCKMDTKIRDNTILKQISEKYGKDIGQIVLRWHLDTEVMPIFTSTKSQRVKDYSDIYDFRLTEEEINTVYTINEDYKLYLESLLCPGY